MATVSPPRVDSAEFPLLLHVLGAMLLVGMLVLAASALVLARRDGSAAMLRLGYRSLVLGALPAWIAMRVGAEWVADKEGWTGDELPSWVDLGYAIAEPGLLLLLVSTLLAGLALRRAGRAGSSSGDGLNRASTVLVALLLIAYLVAVWAMTTKPA